MPLKFSNESPIGSMIEWQLLHGSLARCCSSLARTEVGAFSSSVSSAPSGGGGGGAHSSCSSTHLPRLTGEVRVGLLVSVRKLAWVKKPWRLAPAMLTRSNVLPVGPVMP